MPPRARAPLAASALSRRTHPWRARAAILLFLLATSKSSSQHDISGQAGPGAPQHPGGATSNFPGHDQKRRSLVPLLRGAFPCAPGREVRSPGVEGGCSVPLPLHFGKPHGCGRGRGDVAAGRPAPESAAASDAEPEGPSEAEKAKGAARDPGVLVRRLAAARQGLFLPSGTSR